MVNQLSEKDLLVVILTLILNRSCGLFYSAIDILISDCVSSDEDENVLLNPINDILRRHGCEPINAMGSFVGRGWVKLLQRYPGDAEGLYYRSSVDFRF
jgi:hypothetical protein